MLLGFNLLLWTTHVTEEHFPLFAALKRTGYDGVEVPIFEGTEDHFARIGRILKDEGLRCNGVTVLPDQAHNAVSPDPAARAGAVERLRWAVRCLEAMGGEVLLQTAVCCGVPAANAAFREAKQVFAEVSARGPRSRRSRDAAGGGFPGGGLM